LKDSVTQQATLTAPAGVAKVEWSLNGSARQAGSIAGSWRWRPSGVGLYTVRAWLTDSLGNVDSATSVVVAAQDYPLITDRDTTIKLSDSLVTSTLAKSRFGTPAAVYYRWIEGGLPQNQSSLTQKFGHRFSAPGTYMIHDSASDPQGQSVTDSFKVTVTFVPVKISTTTGPDSVFFESFAGKSGALVAGTFSAPDGVASSVWYPQWPSRTTSVAATSGQTATLTYPAVGTYTPAYLVKGKWGDSDLVVRTVRVVRERPRITLADTLVVNASTPDSLPMTVADTWETVTSADWSWTDASGPHKTSTNATSGWTLKGAFPMGGFKVYLKVYDAGNDTATDSVYVVAKGVNASLAAVTRVATKSPLGMKGSYVKYPSSLIVSDQRIVCGNAAADTAKGVDTTTCSYATAGTYFPSFQVFVGGQWTKKLDTITVVDDPPIIQTFAIDTIGEGIATDLSFTATRSLGKIKTFLWDLTDTLGRGAGKTRVVSRSQTSGPLLQTFKSGTSSIYYGVVTDGNDTVWQSRVMFIRGKPKVIPDTLGRDLGGFVNVGCEVGIACTFGDSLLKKNDLAGVNGASATVVGVLDQAILTKSSGNLLQVTIPAQVATGDYRFRYVISNGTLNDTGFFVVQVWEATVPATFAARIATLETDSLFDGTTLFDPASGSGAVGWKDAFVFAPEAPITSIKVYYPTGFSSFQRFYGRGSVQVAVPGEDIRLSDSTLASWSYNIAGNSFMTGEDTSASLMFQVTTARTDGKGIPGKVKTIYLTKKYQLQRYPRSAVFPGNFQDSTVFPTTCAGIDTQYQINFNFPSYVHEGDQIFVTLDNNSIVNGGLGIRPSDITATFTDYAGKPWGSLKVWQAADGKIRIDLPIPVSAANSGGSMDLRIHLTGVTENVFAYWQAWTENTVSGYKHFEDTKQLRFMKPTGTCP